jgi:hypothetical protein
MSNNKSLQPYYVIFDVPVKFDSKFLAARKNSITTYPEKGQDKQAHVSAIAHEV